MSAKRFARIIAVCVISAGCFIMMPTPNSCGYEGESIWYVIKPLGGQAVYLDSGLTDLDGRQVRLTIFKTNVFGFKDTEKIYSDPETLLPIKVERDVIWWFGREYIVEDYNQKDFKVVITKIKRGKKVSEQVFSADGPISNAILVPFYLRKISALNVGWSFVFRLPQEYKARLVSLEEISAGQEKHLAYHFTSTPDKFEIWISNDDARVPLKIKGKGKFNYTLLMKEHKYSSANQ